MSNEAKLAVASLSGNAVAAAAEEAHIYLIAKIKQKNGGTFKLLDAVDIDWTGFDWTGVQVPTYTLPVATDKVLGGVKIGANISKADDGTISVSADNVKAALGFTPADSALFPEGKVNADTLAGKAATDYALKTDVNNALNGLDWKNNVADATALKAIAKPTEGMTVSLADTNAIYRFDAQNTATADADDASVLVATDKTAGAWLRIGSAVYSPATAQADGLMSKDDKAKLDAFATADQYAKKTDIKTYTAGNNIQISDTNEIGVVAGVYAPAADLDKKVDKDGYIAYSQDEKDKLAALYQTNNVVYVNINIGSGAKFAVPEGTQPIHVNDVLVDNGGDYYYATKVEADGVTPSGVLFSTSTLVNNGLGNKVDKVDGKGLSTNDYDAASKAKVDGLANIKTIGTGLALDENGNLTATAQATEFVSDDFINGLFA